MKVSDLLAARAVHWSELSNLCDAVERRGRSAIPADDVLRFGALYRAACADLALADAYQLPPATLTYLHQLVGRAHNQLYRSRMFQFRRWANELLVVVPRRLFSDRYLWLAFTIFWGVFLLAAVVAYRSPDFAESLIGKETMERIDDDFSTPLESNPLAGDASWRVGMAGFYIYHNSEIGLRCFAFGLVYGVGGLATTVFNAGLLGAMFGHMAGTPHAENFFHFVTAHGPLELTAIVLSAAAGMRLGFSLLNTGGLTRTASLRQAAVKAMPIMGAAIVLFVMAALVEAFLSPSPAPYWVKAGVAVATSGMLMFYFVGLGYPGEE